MDGTDAVSPCGNGDPYSDPLKPRVVLPGEILKAQELVKTGIVRTPCTPSRLSDRLGCDLYFKKDQMQYTGSFKDRGAMNVLKKLSAAQRKRGVITTSAGNHSQSMAYQGRKLGIEVTVVMPLIAPQVKVQSCKSLKANVILHGDTFDEAKVHAMRIRNEKKLLYIDGFDHPDVIAGQGTMGFEIMDDVPDADYLIVQIGGGGLIAGVSVAAKYRNPNVTVIGVESERCPGWHTASKNNGPTVCYRTMTGARQSLSDGLNVARVGYNAFATAQVDKLITVPERYLPTAMLHLLEMEKAVVEGAGAMGYAACLSGKLPEIGGKKVVCILSGGNIDANVLVEVINRALVNEGRLSRFTVWLGDRPGEISALLKVLADLQVNVKDIDHERSSVPSYVYMAMVCCTIETRDSCHLSAVRGVLSDVYGEHLNWDLSKGLPQKATSSQSTVSP